MGKMQRDILRFSLKTIARMLWDTQRGAVHVNGSTKLSDADIGRRLDAAKEAMDSLVTEYYESRGVYD